MKNKVFFKVPAKARGVFARDYFNIQEADGEMFIPTNYADRVEYSLYRMVCDVWRDKTSYEIYGIKFTADKEQKKLLRAAIKHLRSGWIAFIDGDKQLVRNEFQSAENLLLRSNGMKLANIAGKSMLKAQHSSFINRENSKAMRKKTVTREAILVFRNEFERRSAIAGNTNPLHGWKEAALIEFGVSLKTLNKRLKD